MCLEVPSLFSTRPLISLTPPLFDPVTVLHPPPPRASTPPCHPISLFLFSAWSSGAFIKREEKKKKRKRNVKTKQHKILSYSFERFRLHASHLFSGKQIDSICRVCIALNSAACRTRVVREMVSFGPFFSLFALLHCRCVSHNRERSHFFM